MKKVSLLIVLALIVSIGGVYATWNYAQGDVGSVDKALDSVTVITDKVVDAVAKGNVSIDVSNLSLVIDDENNDHVAELKQSGYITITFTPSAGADASVVANGIPLQYTLSCLGGEFQYQGDHIFDFNTVPVVLNGGAAAKTFTIPAADLGISLNGAISLPTVDDYNAFYTALHSGALMITVTEYEPSL